MRQVFIGIITEGSTDARFLEKIVERTFYNVALDCYNDIEPVIQTIKADKSDSPFSDYVVRASQKGVEDFGMMILCVHCDADARDIENVVNNKITPAVDALNKEDANTTCQILVPVIPIQMIEAWMLADRQLLKEEIGTDLTDNELGINKSPELITDPKKVIGEAIRIARQKVTKRRRHDLTISDLYMPIGQKVSFESLQTLSSFQHFQEGVRSAYRQLHLLP
ncbi:MAG: hypothetical protein ACI4TV_01810 [Paludibacteraceae bacterium]